MNNIIVLIILIVILIIIFAITFILLSKNQIEETLNSIEIANDDINSLLKQKFSLYKEIVTYIKDNISIKETAFEEFLEYNKREYTKNDLIEILDKTTIEINEYVDNYNDLLKQKDFIELKRKLYSIEINLEAAIDYYNEKNIIYNKQRNSGITGIASKLFSFIDYENVSIDKKEISRLINLN